MDFRGKEAFLNNPKTKQAAKIWKEYTDYLHKLRGEYDTYVEFEIDDKLENKHEAGLLKLNCDKAFQKLKWLPKLNFENTVEFTADWYSSHYTESYLLTIKQIQTFFAQDSNI